MSSALLYVAAALLIIGGAALLYAHRVLFVSLHRSADRERIKVARELGLNRASLLMPIMRTGPHRGDLVAYRGSASEPWRLYVMASDTMATRLGSRGAEARTIDLDAPGAAAYHVDTQ